MRRAIKNKKETTIAFINVVLTEIILCGINQIMFSKPYFFVYALFPVVFLIFESIFCYNIDNFFSDNKGVMKFFIFKGIKLFTVAIPVFAYIFAAKEPDIWIPIRACAYYLVFLVVETLMSVKHQEFSKK